VPRPVIFISHSSRDRGIVEQLQPLIESETAHAADVYLSSDGRSIPWGRNWSQEIDQALQRATLMLVVLTPSALDSSWIAFEAGYACCRHIPVVPIGLAGVDISKIPAPLGLLQGLTIQTVSDVRQLTAIVRQALGQTNTPLPQVSYEPFLVAASAAHPRQPPNGPYRVVVKRSGGEVEYEIITLTIANGVHVVVRADEWESVGLWGGSRYVGRFKYHRGSNPTDMGNHDMQGDGHEYRGCCRFDNGTWEAEGLIWRPIPKPPDGNP
jgi:hypothetical protein